MSTTANSPNILPILYSFRRCPYAIRARMALQYADVKYEIREVVLKNKPEPMLQVSPKGTVPVLVLENCVIEESLEIMHWALQQRDSDGWFPEIKRKTITSLIKENDTEFKSNLDRYKYPNRYSDSNGIEHRKQAEHFLLSLEERLKEHRFLVGETISLADIAIFPFVRQFSKVDIDWFQTSFHYLKTWLEYHLQSSLFMSVMVKYSPWSPENQKVICNARS